RPATRGGGLGLGVVGVARLQWPIGAEPAGRHAARAARVSLGGGAYNQILWRQNVLQGGGCAWDAFAGDLARGRRAEQRRAAARAPCAGGRQGQCDRNEKAVLPAHRCVRRPTGTRRCGGVLLPVSTRRRSDTVAPPAG